MRRLLVGMVVAAILAAAPAWVLAGNQEVAEQIAANLRKSGQLKGYKIGVRFQDGTAWLSGRVSSQSQMETALKLAAETPGVNRVVNYLTVSPPAADQSTLSHAAGALRPEAVHRPISTDLTVPSVGRPRAILAGRVSQVDSPPTPTKPSLAQRLADSVLPRLMPSTDEPKPAAPKSTPASSQPLAERISTAADGPSSFNAIPAEHTAAVDRPYRLSKPAEAKPISSESAAPAQPQLVSVPVVSAPAGYYVQQPVPVMVVGQPMPVTGAQPVPQYVTPVSGVTAPARYDQPHLPAYAWPSYAAYPNYAALTYPKQYSPTAWPYIGPFYPYPQVPLGWRKVVLEWHDGWWHLNFDDGGARGGPISGLFRPPWKHRR